MQNKLGRYRQDNPLVHVDKFMVNFTPESAYLLGLLWADGYIREAFGKFSTVQIEIQEEDAFDRLISCPICNKIIYSFSNRKYCSNECYRSAVNAEVRMKRRSKRDA